MRISNVHRALICATAIVLLSACASNSSQTTPAENSSSINVDLGVAYIKKGDYASAKAKLEKAIQQNPRNAAAHGTKALLNIKLKQTEEADNDFQKAVDLDPTNSAIRNNYGTFLCQQNRVEAAEQQFLAAVKDPLYPTPEFSYTNAGLCLLKINKLDKAEEYFRKALEANPKFRIALFEMAKISFTKKEYLSARAYLQRYNEVARHTAESLWLRIRVEKELGDKDTVASQALLLKSKFPRSKETAQLLEMEKDEQK